MTSLRSIHSLAWSWWRSMWSLWRRGQRLSKTMPNNWGRPHFFLIVLLCCSLCQYVCVYLCLHGSMLKGCLWNVCGVLWPLLGQNLTCFWNTGLILQLQCARSPSFSLHPWCSQLSPSLQAHIWCSAELCWRGEEVGADWRVIDRMWSEGE